MVILVLWRAGKVARDGVNRAAFQIQDSGFGQGLFYTQKVAGSSPASPTTAAPDPPILNLVATHPASKEGGSHAAHHHSQSA